MTQTDTTNSDSRTAVTSDGMWVEQRGTGPDVLLISGLGDPLEAWTAQLEGLADRYRLLAFDNRGVGRSPRIPDSYSVAAMADDAAEVLRASNITAAHIAGFSGGSVIAQELALRHPELVRSLVLVSTWARSDAYVRAMTDSWRWLPDAAPSEQAMLAAFFLWIYTPRAHDDGMVAQLIEDALAFPHPQSGEDFQRQLDAFMTHDTFDRLPQIAVPTFVIAGEIDIATPPRFGRIVAERIPNARFEVLTGEAHQPFQESPVDFNERVDAFWRGLDGSTEGGRRG